MACFVCGGTARSAELGGRLVNGYRLEKCADCGIVTIERDDGTAPGATIFTDYGDYLTSRPEDNERVIADILRRQRRQFGLIRRHYGAAARVLDFGCGAGFWVQAARRSGFACEGLEVSQHLAEFSRARFGFAPCAAVDELQGEFDVIYMDNVIEHLDQHLSPGLLTQLLGHLRPGGLLLGRTPNYASWNVRLLGAREPVVSPPSHSVYFTLQSLDRYLAALGLVHLSSGASGLNVAAFFRPRPDQYSFIERPASLAQRLLALALRVCGKAAGVAAGLCGGGYMIDFAYRKPAPGATTES
jgi:SAM-dependent methyltransferase